MLQQVVLPEPLLPSKRVAAAAADGQRAAVEADVAVGINVAEARQKLRATGSCRQPRQDQQNAPAGCSGMTQRMSAGVGKFG